MCQRENPRMEIRSKSLQATLWSEGGKFLHLPSPTVPQERLETVSLGNPLRDSRKEMEKLLAKRIWMETPISSCSRQRCSAPPPASIRIPSGTPGELMPESPGPWPEPLTQIHFLLGPPVTPAHPRSSGTCESPTLSSSASSAGFTGF